MRSFRDTEGIGFTMLQDPEGSTFESYGILNESHSKTVPHPTVVVVDSEGIARLVVSDDNYKVRAPSVAVVNAVRRLAEVD